MSETFFKVAVMSALWLSVLLAVGLGSIDVYGARILGIFPTPSISHQLPFQAVMKALAARGHEVTVVSTDPLKTPQSNYTDVDLSFSYGFIKQVFDFNDMVSKTPYDLLQVFEVLGNVFVDGQLSSDTIQDFIKSNLKFDLVFIECLNYQAYYGLVHHVGSPPIIGILSLGAFPGTYDLLGNPNNPSYDPDVFWPYDDHMDFWQRMNNMIFGLKARHTWNSVILPSQEKIMRKYFGDGPPKVVDTERNFSLVMVNNHWSLSYPIPLLPNFIELGSLHLSKVTPLPKDLRSFLDDADEGFIYFSLGSNVRSDKMSAEKRQHFLDAFAELPQRVLWKWESEEMPGKPPNVRLGKWLPQTGVLAHPKIRLFITQGGLQSMGEAVQNAVPLVGMPFVGDQDYNVKKFVSSGIGLKLDFHELSKDNILKVLRTVLNDSSFAENVKKLSAVSKDQPETPLERAVWWTEYVLRHKGAPYLRSAALDLAWYQYLLLDVYAFLAASLFISFFLLYFVVKKLCSFLSRQIISKPKKD